MLDLGFLPDQVKTTSTDYLWLLGLVTATLTAWVGIRNVNPSASRFIAWPFRMFWSGVVGILRIPRWCWRQLWRDASGISRGPLTRLWQRVRQQLATIISDTNAPQFEASRSAALAQHGEQNVRLDAMTDRLDRGGEVIRDLVTNVADLRARIDVFEVVTVTTTQVTSSDKG